jgi:hypothetical protein
VLITCKVSSFNVPITYDSSLLTPVTISADSPTAIRPSLRQQNSVNLDRYYPGIFATSNMDRQAHGSEGDPHAGQSAFSLSSYVELSSEQMENHHPYFGTYGISGAATTFPESSLPLSSPPNSAVPTIRAPYPFQFTGSARPSSLNMSSEISAQYMSHNLENGNTKMSRDLNQYNSSTYSTLHRALSQTDPAESDDFLLSQSQHATQDSQVSTLSPGLSHHSLPVFQSSRQAPNPFASPLSTTTADANQFSLLPTSVSHEVMSNIPYYSNQPTYQTMPPLPTPQSCTAPPQLPPSSPEALQPSSLESNTPESLHAMSISTESMLELAIRDESTTEEEKFLVRCRRDRMRWRDIALSFENETGKKKTVSALQMQYKRFLQRLTIWTNEDVSWTHCAASSQSCAPSTTYSRVGRDLRNRRIQRIQHLGEWD